MPLRYTGSASTFYIPGDPKPYKNGDIVPISQRDAQHMIEQSSLHSFEITNSGEDLEEKLTQPDTPAIAFASDPVSTPTPSSGKATK